MLTAAVIPPAGIALGILVGQHAADGLHHGEAGVVLTGDHLQAVLLAMLFGQDGGVNVGVLLLQIVHFNERLADRFETSSIVKAVCHFVNWAEERTIRTEGSKGSKVEGW